jgi:citrate synthase
LAFYIFQWGAYTVTHSLLAPKGLEGIVVEKTELSRVDGANGILVYRGYNIDEVAQCSFEEICHLFLHGELPNRAQLRQIDDHLRSEREVPKAVLNFISDAPQSEHPMALLRTAVSMLSGYMPKIEDTSKAALHQNAIALTSKVATISAAISRAREGLKPIAPDMSLGHAANYLYMSMGNKPEDVVAKTLDTALVLHADHGFNASTFTARVVTSSLSDMVSAVTAAVGSLKGPLHGGANTAVMEMLQEIGDLENVEPWIAKTLAEKRKVMGFGHRVYTTLDPRAKHLKRMSKEWGERAGNVKWFLMSEKIEELMQSKKRINANVDFYSASTYYAMGIKPEMFTVIFAVARTIGWVAHIIEQLVDNRIMRPEADYIGPEGKKFVAIDNR